MAIPGILHNLGVDTTLVARRGAILRTFDEDVAKNLMSEMNDAGQKVISSLDQILSIISRLPFRLAFIGILHAV